MSLAQVESLATEALVGAEPVRNPQSQLAKLLRRLNVTVYAVTDCSMFQYTVNMLSAGK